MSSLTSEQIAEITAALETAVEIVAGDTWTHFTAAGVRTDNVMSLAYDVNVNMKFAEGLVIDNSGLTLDEVREVTFLTKELAAKGITIDPTDHFEQDGVRWDFAKDAGIQGKIVPLAGIHNMITCYLRKAVELEQTDSVTGDFTFE